MDRKLAWERVKRFLDDDDEEEEEEKEDETAKTSGMSLSLFLNPLILAKSTFSFLLISPDRAVFK